MALTDPHAVQLIDEVVQGNKRLLLGVVRPLGGTEPPEGAVMQARAHELYEVGTLGTVVRMLKLGDGSVRVMVQGLERARLVGGAPPQHWLGGGYEPLPNTVLEDARTEALRRTVHAQFSRVIDIAPYLGEELHEVLVGITDGGKLADFVAANLDLALPAKAELLAIDDVNRRLERLAELPGQELQVLEVFATLPWSRTSADRLDLKAARDILDRDHYDLKTVKERILEYLAVRTLNPAARGGILCFVGPPGVGKTSLGQSIAEALGRRFTRVSLGGVRDEAEVRGHRRTYVGALPGRIIHALQRCETRNPLLMLDEVDKMGADVRGDPTAALLEVLDPAQNGTFVDHYLEVPFDLSGVMFIATANALGPIPDPLLDRMEVLALPGYTPGEKLAIAKRFLLPRQLKETGLTVERAGVADAALERLIAEYTREAGVRQLEREIQGVLRKAALEVVEGRAGTGAVKITVKNLEKYAGPPKGQSEGAGRSPQGGGARGGEDGARAGAQPERRGGGARRGEEAARHQAGGDDRRGARARAARAARVAARRCAAASAREPRGPAVSDFATLQEAFERIGQQDGRHHERGYLFVLAALEYAQGRLPARRHLSGAELAWACREFALERFGLLAPTVLHHWGITRTDDLGHIVFALIDVGLLARQPSDKREDFERVYDFAEVFRAGYRWPGVEGARE